MSSPDPTPGQPPAGGRGALAGAVAAAVDTVPGVRRSGGAGVEVATQYAGGRVLGVQLGDGVVTVHIVAERLPLDAVVDPVRSAALAALGALGDHRPVAVTVDDLDVDALPRGSLR